MYAFSDAVGVSALYTPASSTDAGSLAKQNVYASQAPPKAGGSSKFGQRSACSVAQLRREKNEPSLGKRVRICWHLRRAKQQKSFLKEEVMNSSRILLT